jgi:hypothetical protein
MNIVHYYLKKYKLIEGSLRLIQRLPKFQRLKLSIYMCDKISKAEVHFISG